jgi:hypothetical protein
MAIIPAASATVAAVQAAVNLASDGDTVTIPNGSQGWSSGITTTKQIRIMAQNTTPTNQGPGTTAATRNVTLTHNAGSAQLFNMTSGDSFHVQISGIRFNEGTGTGNYIRFNGTGTKPPRLNDVYIENDDRFGSSTDVACIAFLSLGGVMWNLWQTSLAVNGTSIASAGIIVKSPRAWDTASTLGALDTGGVVNVYMEDSTGYQTGSFPDVDVSGRFVARHVRFDGSIPITHGFTSTFPNQGRSMEFYDSVFQVTNQNRNHGGRYVWFRAGHGVLTDNVVEDNAGTEYSAPSEFVMGESTPAPGSYPQPHQPGWGHNGTTNVIDPIYSWNNTGARAYTAGILAPWTTTHLLQNREYFVNNGAKPGYGKFTYPHPLRTEGGDTTPPAAPTNLRFT